MLKVPKFRALAQLDALGHQKRAPGAIGYQYLLVSNVFADRFHGWMAQPFEALQ